MSAVGVVAPSREDPFVATMSPVAGGPCGTRVRPGRHGWWTTARVLVVLAMFVLALGVVEKQHCRAHGWTSPDQFFHGCYSDLPIVYQTSGLDRGASPYAANAGPAQQLDQPVVTGAALWLVAEMVPRGDLRSATRWYFDLSTLLIAGLLVALVGTTVASAGRRRPFDAALVALSPLVALSALVSLDLLGVTLAAGGLLAWGRRRPVLAGVLLGLATMARTYPVLLVLVLGLLSARAGHGRVWARTAAATAGTCLAVLVPWWLAGASGLGSVYRDWAKAAAGYGSPWLLPQTLFAAPRPGWMTRLGLHSLTLAPGVVTTLTVLGVVVALGIGAALSLGSARRPRVAQVAFVVLAVVVLTGKAWPVQASLWLLPLAALAHPRWRDHLVWVGTEAVYFMAVWLYAAGTAAPDRALPATWYSAFLVARAGGLLWLVWCVVHEIRDPARDVVRLDGSDDPLGGPLEHAGDALGVRTGRPPAGLWTDSLAVDVAR